MWINPAKALKGRCNDLLNQTTCAGSARSPTKLGDGENVKVVRGYREDPNLGFRCIRVSRREIKRLCQE